MRLMKEDSVFNFGDTSFRRKSYMNEFKSILKILNNHMSEFDSWSKNEESQSVFYDKILSQTEIFKRNEKGDDNKAKRGRTLTNSLVKVGLITEKRNITEVGKHWIENNLKHFDALEKIFNITKDNLVFLRQWSKFKVFSKETPNYFSPFIWCLKFLSVYPDVMLQQFISILHNLKINSNEEYYINIIKNYSKVVNNNMIFDEFMDLYVEEKNNNDKEIKSRVNYLFSSPFIDEDLFNEIFTNGKSQGKAGQEYITFVELLIKFKETCSLDDMKRLVEMGKEGKIKKAFGFGKIVFKLPPKPYEVQDFIELNQDTGLFSSNKFNIYDRFRKSKRYDLVKEYGDLTQRLLTLTGVIEFENGLVNLPFRHLFRKLFEKNNVFISGEGSYDDYEKNPDSQFFKDVTLIDILAIDNKNLSNTLIALAKEYDLVSTKDLPKYFEKEKERKLTKLIEEKFSKENIIDILMEISLRNDSKVNELVTPNTNIPTIFEYITGIAWYHLSNKNINLLKSLNLTLDADLLPLSHASGGEGDIVIDSFAQETLMIEATLMNKNAQKRGELEPVIRHATNLTIRSNKPVKTFFIADELDNNVINIFKASSFIELEGTNVAGTTDGVTIFPMTISEVITALSNNVSTNDIIEIIHDKFNHNISFTKIGWREEIIKSILN